MQSLLDAATDFVKSPVEQGDMGIILKADRTFQIFATGIDHTNLTAAQREDGEKLIALAVALKHQPIMDVLLSMSRDPEIVGHELIAMPKVTN